MAAYTDESWEESWYEWQCYAYKRSCPCSYSSQPLFWLRGLCSPLIDDLFSPKQLPGDPGNMIILGQLTTRIEYNDTTSQWVLTDAKYEVTAMSRATKLSYLLGKHDWTIGCPKKPKSPNFVSQLTPLVFIFGIFGHIWHIWVHIWARAIWSSGVSLKRSCKMQFRRIGLRSIGPSSQKL